MKRYQHYLFDWGDTLMVDLPGQVGPMCDWPEIKLVEGAIECLSVLSKVAHCHVATNALNSNQGQIRAAFERAGLSPFIANIFCAEEIGFHKPQGEYFQFIIETLEVPAGEIVMIGDSLEKDIYGALRQGMDALWFNPNHRPVPKEIIGLTGLSELTFALASKAAK